MPALPREVYDQSKPCSRTIAYLLKWCRGAIQLSSIGDEEVDSAFDIRYGEGVG